MDNDQIVITHPTFFFFFFAMGADQTLQLPYVAFYHQEKKNYLVIFRDQVTRDHKYLTHKDTCHLHFNIVARRGHTSCDPLASQAALQYVAMLRFQFLLATGPEACMMACPQSSEYLQLTAPFLADAV